MRPSKREQEFREYAAARESHLRRSAYLLSGDWYEAQDLTQTTLMKLYAAWGSVRADGNGAMSRLPPGFRAVLVLRFWEDLDVEATAHARGLDRNGQEPDRAGAGPAARAGGGRHGALQ